jgi:hypothetical protein
VNILRRRLQPVAWIALLAIWALALLPTVSHALAFSRGDNNWAEVCSPQGMRLVAVGPVDAETAAPVDAVGAALDQCPFCALSAAAWAPPPASPTTSAHSPGAGQVGLAWRRLPRVQFAWPAAQQRGPPVRS